MKRKQKYVDIAGKYDEQCPSVSPNGKRCCYVAGHETRSRPHYHCDKGGLEAWEADAPKGGET